jgi:hypothetical protein
MKAVTIFAASAALLIGHAALAAAPKLSGHYSFTSSHICQVSIQTSSDGHLTALNNTGQAHNFKVGTATMSAGNLSFSGVMVEGASLIVNGAGMKMSLPSAVSFSGAFSTTATTFTFDGKTFQAAYADIDANGIAHHATFLLRDNTQCATVSTAVRQ